MNHLYEFSADPTVESYKKILGSKKTQNQLGEAFTVWQSAILLKHYDNPDWQEVVIQSGKSREKLEEENKTYHIDVISKLIASPRLGLLYKAWGMFFATAELVYLQTAFETAGNSRSSGSVKSIAIKLYQDLGEFYGDCRPSGSPFYATFGEMEDKIFEKQKILRELESDNLFRKYVLETEQKFPKEKSASVEAKELEDKILGKDKKDKRVEDAGKIFDKIATEVFTKVV